MARSRNLSVFENAPVRRRPPFWAVPALMLSAYLGAVVFDAGVRPDVANAAVTPRHQTARGLEAPAAAAGVRGMASWYGAEFHGLPMASGEPFNMHAMTAAHRTLPLGSRARVTNLENGESVVVRITDRGPHIRRRIIDLSYGAAQELAMVADGSVLVEVVPLAS